MAPPTARPSDALVVAVEGPSGSGKTSVASELARRMEAVLVPEAYDRLGRRPPLQFRDRSELAEIERTLLAEEGRRWSEADGHRAGGRRVVLDTGTAGPLTYSWGVREGIDPRWDVLPDLLLRTRRLRSSGAWGLPDCTIYLDVSERVAAERAARSAADHPAELRDRHRVVSRFERLLYEKEFPRRLPGRFVSVAAEGSPGEIAEGIRDRWERLGPVPRATNPEVDRFLDLFEGSGPTSGPTGRGERTPTTAGAADGDSLHPNS